MCVSRRRNRNVFCHVPRILLLILSSSNSFELLPPPSMNVEGKTCEFRDNIKVIRMKDSEVKKGKIFYHNFWKEMFRLKKSRLHSLKAKGPVYARGFQVNLFLMDFFSFSTTLPPLPSSFLFGFHPSFPSPLLSFLVFFHPSPS